MKKTGFYLILLSIALSSAEILAQSGVEKKLLATLGAGESLAYGENCFLLDQSPEVISFVTVTGSGSSKQYYCYGKDGSKTGPVKSPDPNYWAGAENKKPVDCIANDEQSVENPADYYDFTTQMVKFQGKSIGPAGQMMMIGLTDDKLHLYAIVVTMEMKLIFFDNTGRKVELSGMPEQIIISPDGKNAFAKVNGTINPFDPEAYTRMMANPEEMQNPKVLLAGIDGSVAGPYLQSGFKDAWFTEAGQWIVYAEQQIFLNGKALFRSDEHFSTCDLWINSTGTNYAWANYETLNFKDGTKFKAPVEIEYTHTAGKGYLKWISLEDGTNLTLYKMPF